MRGSKCVRAARAASQSRLDAQPGQLFEQRVDGRAQSAGEQSALVAGVELASGAGPDSDDQLIPRQACNEASGLRIGR